MVTGATRRIIDFANAHPLLTKALALGAVGLGIFLAVAGTIATVVAGGMMAMAGLRFAMAMSGINALRAGANIGIMGRAIAGLSKLSPLRWAMVIPKLAWKAVITPLKWALFVPRLAWSVAIAPLRWLSFLPRLSWGSAVTALRWASLVPKLSWRLLITPLKWGARLIPGIGWALLAGELAWHLLIKPLGWDQYMNWEALKSAADKVGAMLMSGLESVVDWFATLPSRIINAIGSIDLSSIITLPNLHSWFGGDGPVSDEAKIRGAQGRRERRRRVASTVPQIPRPEPVATPVVSKPEMPVKPVAAVPDRVPIASVPKIRPQVAADAQAARAEIEQVKASADSVPPTVRDAVNQSEAMLAAINWQSHGQAMMATLAAGVTAGGALVKEAVAAELAKARALLPSSNAKEGPLSNLTGNGAAILATMAKGVHDGGDGGLVSAIERGVDAIAAPLLPQLAAAGAQVGRVGATAPPPSNGGNNQQAQSQPAQLGPITINVYPQPGDDPAADIERRLRALMHAKLSD